MSSEDDDDSRLHRVFIHDIKQPLSVAHGHAKLLVSGLMPESQNPLSSDRAIEKAKKIAAALEKMNEMIADYWEKIGKKAAP